MTETALVRGETSSTSSDPRVLADRCHRRVRVSSDAVLLKIDRFGQRFERCGAVQGAAGLVLVTLGLVLAQDLPQMALIPGGAGDGVEGLVAVA